MDGGREVYAMSEETLARLAEAIIGGDEKAAPECVHTLLDQGVEPATILNQGLIKGMDEVGRRFREREYFLPEVLISAEAMHAAMGILRPLLTEGNIEPKGRIVIGTVRGDLHDIGKGIVGMMLEGAGFDVIDLGVDVTPERFVTAATEHQAHVLAMSALLTTTMGEMRGVIGALEAAGIRNRIKVMIGGAPVTAAYAKQIGADAYGEDGAEAAWVARQLVGAAN